MLTNKIIVFTIIAFFCILIKSSLLAYSNNFKYEKIKKISKELYEKLLMQFFILFIID